MNRAAKAFRRARSEYWECQYYAGDTRHDKRWHKRSARRAQRRMVPSLLREQG